MHYTAEWKLGFPAKRTFHEKKAKTIGRISQTILQNFAFFRENEAKFNENF